MSERLTADELQRVRQLLTMFRSGPYTPDGRGSGNNDAKVRSRTGTVIADTQGHEGAADLVSWAMNRLGALLDDRDQLRAQLTAQQERANTWQMSYEEAQNIRTEEAVRADTAERDRDAAFGAQDRWRNRVNEYADLLMTAGRLRRTNVRRAWRFRKERDTERAHCQASEHAADAAQAEAVRLRGALMNIDAIRNDIVGRQTIDWSRHIYPLVAALEQAGFIGKSYAEARAALAPQPEGS